MRRIVDAVPARCQFRFRDKADQVVALKLQDWLSAKAQMDLAAADQVQLVAR